MPLDFKLAKATCPKPTREEFLEALGLPEEVSGQDLMNACLVLTGAAGPKKLDGHPKRSIIIFNAMFVPDDLQAARCV